ncbi:MAG: nucleoside phosphorylase [Candidatus Thorarchaeota archaeon]|nr:MAG: uridine phosphorylase [Candidatus Thorarchaeota archaeon]RLI59038.1 MAG: uridine phosphorylase [Candidatus Thorarchaeota archaeon]
MSDEREYHIGIAPGEFPELVLLPGDPERSQKIAEQFLESATEVARRREFWSFKGSWNGTPVGVCSTGIGCPSAAIALEELVRIGCRTFIRVGTSGAISHTVSTGDLVIFAGAVRDDGTSKQYVPVEFPAVADPVLVQALKSAAERRGTKFHVGVGHSKDAFYSEYPSLVADPEGMKRRWDLMRKTHVLATEMEAASLFVIGYLRQVRVGAVCVAIGENVEKETKIVGKPPLDDLITVALDAITSV